MSEIFGKEMAKRSGQFTEDVLIHQGLPSDQSLILLRDSPEFMKLNGWIFDG